MVPNGGLLVKGEITITLTLWRSVTWAKQLFLLLIKRKRPNFALRTLAELTKKLPEKHIEAVIR